MNWPIVWSHEAEADLFLIHFEAIHAIAGAVRVWAETGGGHTELVDGDRIRVLAPRLPEPVSASASSSRRCGMRSREGRRTSRW